MSKVPAPKKNKALLELARDIIADGVDIEIDDIEKLIDVYERVIKSDTANDTKFMDDYIDPFASINLNTIEEEGINSLNNFLINLNNLKYDKEVAEFVSPISDKTMDAVTYGNNIVMVFKHIESFFHFLGGMIRQYLYDCEHNMYSIFRFTSHCADGGIMSIEGYISINGYTYRYFNNCLIKKP